MQRLECQAALQCLAGCRCFRIGIDDKPSPPKGIRMRPYPRTYALNKASTEHIDSPLFRTEKVLDEMTA